MGVERQVAAADLASRPDLSVSGEWLVANGQGGYASATLSGALTRAYHGLLVAALPEPLGRVVMLQHLGEEVRLSDSRAVTLCPLDVPDDGPPDLAALEGFSLHDGLPVWHHRLDGVVLERRLVMPHRRDTVHVTWRLVQADGPVTLVLRPWMRPRPIHSAVDDGVSGQFAVATSGDGVEVSAGGDWPLLRLRLEGTDSFLIADEQYRELTYQEERARGYRARGSLWSPGRFEVALQAGQSVTLVASTDPWREVLALPPDLVAGCEAERRAWLVEQAAPAARAGVGAELVLAADSFVMAPTGRAADRLRAQARGGEVCSLIAGYHWFTDWGRDTMIALEGLTLVTGRTREAAWIIEGFARHTRQGLIPNLFPEGQPAGVYHTADATLWLFHAVARYLRATDDRALLRRLLPVLRGIVEHHLAGTDFGIGVDPADGLLVQGAEGYALTWMDARCEGWVVTPRRGKAVEINALWYNALCHLADWLQDEVDEAEAAPVRDHAARARDSFNRRFWSPQAGHLFDVVDGKGGDDPACRPNQILALSLDHPVLDRRHWGDVLSAVRQDLLTPVGLRSLAPGHPHYRPDYVGDVWSRDGAYHQGTVWSWLIGPYVDAHLRVHPGDRAGARALLAGLVAHLGDAGIGTVSEVFDAEPPHAPRGCIAQAWGVAELLRAWVATEP